MAWLLSTPKPDRGRGHHLQSLGILLGESGFSALSGEVASLRSLCLHGRATSSRRPERLPVEAIGHAANNHAEKQVMYKDRGEKAMLGSKETFACSGCDSAEGTWRFAYLCIIACRSISAAPPACEAMLEGLESQLLRSGTGLVGLLVASVVLSVGTALEDLEDSGCGRGLRVESLLVGERGRFLSGVLVGESSGSIVPGATLSLLARSVVAVCRGEDVLLRWIPGRFLVLVLVGRLEEEFFSLSMTKDMGLAGWPLASFAAGLGASATAITL